MEQDTINRVVEVITQIEALQADLGDHVFHGHLAKARCHMLHALDDARRGMPVRYDP